MEGWERKLLEMERWAMRARGARWGRQAQTIATEGSMVDQMKTGPMRYVTSAVFMKALRKWMRTILATQTLIYVSYKTIPMLRLKGVQNTNSHDTANSNLLPQCHLQLDDARKRQGEDDKVVQHIEDPQRQEELVDIDTLAGCRAAELSPEEAHGLAGIGHCDPDDEGVCGRDDAGEDEGRFQRFFERGEDA